VTSVSYVDVLRKRVDPEVLKGALVIVGMNDGVLDMHPDPDPSGSPDLAKMAGVFTHAALLARLDQASAAERAEAKPTKARAGMISGLRD
jgi:CHASE2 domain-containing sensor protein